MNLYEFKVSAIVLVEAVNVIQANKACRESVKILGDRVGWRNDKQGARPYRVETQPPTFSGPKRIKP